MTTPRSIGQLEKDLKDAREALQYAESQEQAGRSVLSRKIDDYNKLEDTNEQQALEIERLKAQLSAAEGRNKEMSGSISGKHVVLRLLCRGTQQKAKIFGIASTPRTTMETTYKV